MWKNKDNKNIEYFTKKHAWVRKTQSNTVLVLRTYIFKLQISHSFNLIFQLYVRLPAILLEDNGCL